MSTIYSRAHDPSDEPPGITGTIYVAGSTNEDLIQGLQNRDPSERAKSAQAIGLFHVYVGLPYVLDAARNEPDPHVRETARRAIADLVPPREGAGDRAIAGETLYPGSVPDRSQKDEAGFVIWMFNQYSLLRTDPDHSLGEYHLVGPVVHYFNLWGGQSATDLDDVGLAAAMAAGAIARFLEIPAKDGGLKWMSFRDANERVAHYESILANPDENVED